MSDLTPQEIDVIKACLEGESETLEGCRHISLPSSAVNNSKKVIAAIIEKLDGGTGSIWINTREKLDDLINRHAEAVLVTAERLHNSGGIDPGEYNHGNWAYAKVLMTVALRQHCNDYFPSNTDGDKLRATDIKNLMHF
ncbi:MAG: hypothetical protein DRQ46_08250 [Gammaproteobacteria bacterium]|nr:MAG: hypothetical protein DRQ46_08250 [Gammaproteobacteria bacterium]